ncbi:PIWL1 protein, partial [Bucco capensis]|nr:PIWL1 protein [Bucco capensis]
MSGRARAKTRGRPPKQETAPPSDRAASVPQTLPSQPPSRQQRQQRHASPPRSEEPSGRGRQRNPRNVPQAQEGGGPEEITAGFQELSLEDRRGRRREFHDLGVNTRQTMEHVRKSKTGSSGTLIKLAANYFRLMSRPKWALYQYHVGYSPEMEARSLRSALLFHHENLIGKTHAFDGSILFLPKRLENKVTDVFSRTRNGENVKITITLTNELQPDSPTCLHFYNILFKRLLKLLNLQQIGRNYYNPNDPISIPNHRLMVWPGFATSILQCDQNIMLCVDVSYKVLRSETVLDFMQSLYHQVGEQRFRDACAKELIGLVVLTRYNNKTYRVDDIGWDTNPKCVFKKADGSDISFVDYYQRQYNQKITDLEQPVLISRCRRRDIKGVGPVALIPELCFLTGLTDRMRNDFNVMKDLAVHTRVPPEQRQHEIGRLCRYIQNNKDTQKELQNWGVNFDSNGLPLSGRVVQAEKICQSRNVFQYNPQFADWSKETRGAPLTYPKPMNNWLLIYTGRNSGNANTLLQNLFKVTPSLGIKMNMATMIEVDDRTEAYLRALQQSITPDTNIVLCVLSAPRKDKYDAIKKYLCTECPIPSQCVLARTLSKPQAAMSVATRIALQMNCKMGGELWTVEIPLERVMIVGIDCYHDTLTGKQSVAAFVASLNKTMTRWFSRCVVHGRGQEIVDGLKVCLQSALKEWYKWNKCLPSRIVVYRDGVGDGQLSALVDYEVPQFLASLKSIGQDYNPRLTVVVVKKRVNTRFFAQYGETFKNPPPGTVVDVEVTRQQWYDFFIVSQTVRNGCVLPTHYNVVYDSSSLLPDHMQRLTYKLCHMYYNWSGVIRVPAPCQYAHKLAFLVGESIHREPNLVLSDRLYYL